MQAVIFSVNNNLTNKKKFYKYLDDLRVMYKLKGKPIISIGCYKGVIEESYIVLKEDFDNHLKKSDFLKDQECFMVVSTDYKNRTTAYLDFGSHQQKLGRIVTISREQAYKLGNWTYRPDLDTFWGVSN